MKEIVQELRSTIAKVEPQLTQMNHDDMGLKPAADEWSKKEILGGMMPKDDTYRLDNLEKVYALGKNL